ncbi:hypothetical protein CC85DRAFT_92065 [Cutaneotrichosporon oleaginosum]|uniref:Uncharacterized protein n=1 Tax=Cutaneotrichosporon oleaginosum TaxID=879819 RepID=A0A0J0XYE8_9TREE|nr:uncharacterized protein CC85DRAFT_92065 [Cutaneotrichosporon oleaginosum]KLT46068.1 hypothetical protein CC85DRAFT_92065 [Cutaneotrichosporon oleaginosum]TXT06761.1 hypothetical protein COLE_06092 [Cutaneotrichosporon oleaginosum]
MSALHLRTPLTPATIPSAASPPTPAHIERLRMYFYACMLQGGGAPRIVSVAEGARWLAVWGRPCLAGDGADERMAGGQCCIVADSEG